MFGVGGVEILVGGGLVAVALLAWRYISDAQWVRVDRSTPVGVEASALEVPLARMLSDLPGARLVAGGGATWTLAVQRPQLWALVPTVLLFPFGLLFLLFTENATVVVSVRPAPRGSDVHVLGTTRVSVKNTIEKALAELPPSADAAPRG